MPGPGQHGVLLTCPEGLVKAVFSVNLPGDGSCETPASLLSVNKLLRYASKGETHHYEGLHPTITDGLNDGQKSVLGQ